MMTWARRKFIRFVRDGWPNSSSFHDSSDKTYHVHIDGYPSEDVLLSASLVINSCSEAERAAGIIINRIHREDHSEECHARHHSWDAGWYDSITVHFRTDAALQLLQDNDELRSFLDEQDPNRST
jgi:hypothetical protein